MKTFLRIIVAMLAASTLQAFAQNFPTKPVHVVITFPPGSATDIVGRLVAQKLSDLWGQPVVAENRGGAGGSIGSAVVAKTAPDGYNLLINSNAHAVNPAIYAKLPYDTQKDFVDIVPLSGAPNVFVVPVSSKFKSLADFVAEAKANPGKLNFAHAGVGSGTHLNTEKFKLAAGIDFVQVPYKGTQEIFTDLISGRVDSYFSPMSPVIPQVRDGKLRALAVSSAKRSGRLPEVPTVAESGHPGFEFTLWFGIWGPAGIPADVVAKINRDVNSVLATADVRERLAKLGNDPMNMNPAEFREYVRREIEEYARIIKAAGIKQQ